MGLYRVNTLNCISLIACLFAFQSVFCPFFVCHILPVKFYYYFSFSDQLVIIFRSCLNYYFFVLNFNSFRSDLLSDLFFSYFLIHYIIHNLYFCKQMAAEVPPKVFCADTGKLFPFPVSSYRIADESVEEASCRVFKVGDISLLVDLKDLCRRFGLECNFVSRRSG